MTRGCGPWRRRERLQRVPSTLFEAYANPQARPERGEVRYLILEVVAAGPIHGYEIMATIEARTRGRYRPSPGTVYPTLQALENDGLIVSREQDSRKVYQTTPAGNGEIEAQGEEIADVFARLGGPPRESLSELGFLEDQINRIVGMVGRSLRAGRLDEARLDGIIEAVRSAARQVERILRDK